MKTEKVLQAIKALLANNTRENAEKLAKAAELKLALADDKVFKQPEGLFNIYGANYPRVKPDISTPVKKAMVDKEELIRLDHLETGAFFNEQGVLTLSRQGAPNTVKFTVGELLRNRGGYFTHNHPKGLSFTLDDVVIAAEYHFSELRAVAPRYRHIMTATNGWPTPYQLQAAFELMDKMIAQEVHNEIRVGELPTNVFDQEHTHRVWLKMAKLFNLVYSRENS